LRDDLNNAITDGEIVEMLAQHLITKPVFDALFQDYSFAQHNPMSIAMQDILDKLHEHHIDKEADTLQRFYDSVKMRAEGIDNAAGKQKIVVELYDKFFRNAFPRMTERLGIVYTPVEVVDFILHSVNDALQNEFGQTLGDKNVHIIDPFTGTGTFITRLLQSGLISAAQLPYKYQHEIHANEIVLLAYYIAAINIEAVYHDIIKTVRPELVEGCVHGSTGSPRTAESEKIAYQPFRGICLTDTFQLYEKDDLVSQILVDNSARRTKQKALDIRVIIGNPPYSSGQRSENDNNANIEYTELDQSIRNSYAKNSAATLQKNLYDSYIRAIRWATDRIKDTGVIGFVSGSGFIEKTAMDGMRKCLADEFSSVYVFNLRGDIRKNMLSKGRAKEGQNVFGSGSMTGIAVTLFIKNPNAHEQGKIYYYDIGDDLKEKEKLEKLNSLKSINSIQWDKLAPNANHDWINQRNATFTNFIELGNKNDKTATVIFDNYSLGIATNRDAWVNNFSKNALNANINRMINFYNSQVLDYHNLYGDKPRNERADIEMFIDTNPKKISWTVNIKADLIRNKKAKFQKNHIVRSMYRPYCKQWSYFDRQFNERVYQMPKIFPDNTVENLVICVSGVGARSGFSVLAISHISSLDAIEKGQCFPLKLYEPTQADENQQASGVKPQADLFSDVGAKNFLPLPATLPRYTIKDGITDAGLAHFQAAYPFETLNKEDLFYYIYGLLHSEDYKTQYADNLTKELPRIPCVKQAADFWAFSKAGRDLAELHIHYETVAPYPVTFECGKTTIDELKDADFYVTQMKFAKKSDKSTVIYNHLITLKDIPLEAYDYIVNGKPALEWVMERQAVSTHKDSGIVNDANDWAIETMSNPRYPLELFQRVITVSLETMKIVNTLPKLDI
jgi:predicted helicase